MRTLQSFGGMLIILGLFLGAAWYFHDSFPDLDLGGVVVRIAQPPEWSLMATIGGGTALFIIGTIGTLFSRTRDQRAND